jgi:hypothetical protein
MIPLNEIDYKTLVRCIKELQLVGIRDTALNGRLRRQIVFKIICLYCLVLCFCPIPNVHGKYKPKGGDLRRPVRAALAVEPTADRETLDISKSQGNAVTEKPDSLLKHVKIFKPLLEMEFD